MGEWVILYRKSDDNGISFISTTDDGDDDTLNRFESYDAAQKFIDGSRFLQTRPWQIVEINAAQNQEFEEL